MSRWWRDSDTLTSADRALLEAAVEQGHGDTLPGDDVASARRLAVAAVHDTVGGEPGLELVRHSILGPEWSSDLDIHCTRPVEPRRLLDAGWYRLDRLLARLGSNGEGRWAIVESGRVLGAADFTTAAPPKRITSTAARMRAGASVRDVLELRALLRDGEHLGAPAGMSDAVDLERSLGGHELPVTRASTGERLCRLVAALVRRRPRRSRPKVIVAFSGVDGAGKSSVIERFTQELQLAGVPTSMVWARPGHDLGWLDGVARTGKRILGHQPEPGIRAVAAGATMQPASRRGLGGRIWRRLMVVEFVVKVRRKHRRTRGLVVYDRHALDAAVTLAFAYGLDRRWVLPLLRRALPAPDVHVYLDIDADTATARKPDDPMGHAAIVAQLDLYDRMLAGTEDVLAIDATRSIDDIAAEIWQAVLASAHT